MLGGSGLLLGAVAAPVFEPTAFRYPSLWQASFGALGGIGLAAGLAAPVEAMLFGALAGLIAGYLAEYWLHGVPLP